MTGPGDLKTTILHHVDELAKLFGVNLESDRNVFTHVEKLRDSISTFGSLQVNPQSVLAKLCDSNPQAGAFMKSYEELRLKNIRELLPLVYVFWRIKSDPALLSAVGRPFNRRALTSLSLSSMKSPECVRDKKDVTYLQQLIADSEAATAASTLGQRISEDRVRRAFDYLTVSQQSGRHPEVSGMMDASSTVLGGLATRPGSSASSHGFAGLVGGQSMTSSSRAGVSTVGQTTVLPVGAGGGGGIPVTSQQKSVTLPAQPEWLYERPVLQDAYLSPDLATGEIPPTVPIETLPLALQENVVVADLLQLLHGSQGVYIKPIALHPGHHVRSFGVSQQMSPALLDTVNKVLPLCRDYSTISRFIQQKSRFEYGMVNQALAAAMRHLVKDYLILVCQLEHQYRIGHLGIARLQFFLQDTALIFSHLARIATDISVTGCTGGAVLSLLNNCAREAHGVTQVLDLMTYLLRSAAVPFFKILQKWLYRGIISDPYHEFFIAAGPTPDFIRAGRGGRCTAGSSLRDRGSRDQVGEDYLNWAIYWEKHYSVVSTNLPNFLESHLTKILNTGKYLNVVQQCGDDTCEMPKVENLQFDTEDNAYLDQIDRAYETASSLVLQLMIRQEDLKEHLKSVKRYFLLDQADFVIHFMDVADKELCKPSTAVSLSRLTSLFELAIRSSTASVDPNNENLRLLLFNYDLISQILLVLRVGSGLAPAAGELEDLDLTALEAFSIDYVVEWPISLVLNRQVMDRYQMLFRHLFYCKHVERLLCNSWVLGKLARRTNTLSSSWFTTAFLLSQRMLTFIQHFQYYMTVEVIEPTWEAFFKNVDKASNLDSLLDSHLHCVELCMDDCLLANPKLLKLFGQLCAVCVTFANFIRRVLSASGVGEPLLPGLGVDPAGSRSGIPPRSSSSQAGNVLALSESCSLGSKLSLYSSTTSLDTLFTKVTRDDLNQVGISDTFARTVLTYDNNFNRHLVQLLEEIKEQAKQFKQLSSLVSRLDFNQFYTQYAAELEVRETTLMTPRGDHPVAMAHDDVEQEEGKAKEADDGTGIQSRGQRQPFRTRSSGQLQTAGMTPAGEGVDAAQEEEEDGLGPPVVSLVVPDVRSVPTGHQQEPFEDYI